jgi:hypothetical protein
MIGKDLTEEGLAISLPDFQRMVKIDNNLDFQTTIEDLPVGSTTTDLNVSEVIVEEITEEVDPLCSEEEEVVEETSTVTDPLGSP